MTSASPPIKILGWMIFLFFMALLTRNILFKKNFTYYTNYFRHEYKQYKVSDGWKLANTKPFHTIKLFYNSHNLSNEYKANNLLGNIIGFIPFGIFLPFLLPWFRHIFKTLVAGLVLSLGYELTQLKFGLGVFDVDDLILNTAGCIVGYVVFKIGWWLFAGNKQQTNVVTDL
jgi:glycopeptide antibiotics resistance protein